MTDHLTGAPHGHQEPAPDDELGRIQVAITERLARLRFGRPVAPDDIGVRVLTAFRAGVPGYLTAIASAIDDGDMTTVRQQTHDLTSLVGHIGAEAMTDLCGQLRECAHADDLAGSAAVLADLRAGYDTTCRAIDGL